MNLDLKHPQLTEHFAINQEIVQCFIAAVPVSWNAAELTVQFVAEGARAEARIRGATPEETSPLSMELEAAVERLRAHREKFRQPWKSVCFSVRRDPVHGWEVSAAFE